jgi:hypothetical protein
MKIFIYLLEGIAVTIAIYLIAKKSLSVRELLTLGATIGVTFMILDLFAPSVSSGARQGTGFGLGFQQVGGLPTPMPLQYYNPEMANSNGNCHCGMNEHTNGVAGEVPGPDDKKKNVIEGMDDPIAKEYYSMWNPPSCEGGKAQPSGIQAKIYNAKSIASKTYKEERIIPSPSGQPPKAVTDGHAIENFASVPETETANGLSEETAEKLIPTCMKNPVRSFTEIERPGAFYDSGLSPVDPVGDKDLSDFKSDKLAYNPLKPTYGYRYQLPSQWDDLEQN